MNLNIKPYKFVATYQAIALADEKDFSVLELVDTNKIEFNHTSNGDDVFNGRHPCNVSLFN